MHPCFTDRFFPACQAEGGSFGGAGSAATDFTLATEDGHIGGKLYRPEEAGPWPLVICSHGFTATHENMTETCQELVHLGVAAISFDFRNSNGTLSSGDFLQMSVETEVSDLNRLLAACRESSYFDPQKIVLLGHSQGGLVSALTAARHPDEVAGLVLMYPAFSITDTIHALFPDRDRLPDSHQILGATVGRVFAEDIWDLDVYKEIAAYDKPVLIIHGGRDEIVPIEYSERALDLSYDLVDMVYLPDAGHGFHGEDFDISMKETELYLQKIGVIP